MKDINELMQGLIKKFMDTLEPEKKYAEGDKSWLATTIVMSCFARVPIPPWAQDALVKSIADRPKSWDDVFGPLHEKGKHLDDFFKRMDLLTPVLASTQMRAKNSALEPDLFDEVGEGLDISGRTASRIYYRYDGVVLPLLDIMQKELANRLGEEKAAASFEKAMAILSIQKPGEAIGDTLKMREILNSENPVKNMSEFLSSRMKQILNSENPDKSADLSDFLDSLTKTR